MSQSLRAVKRFCIRELAPQQKSRIPPAATAASILHAPEVSSPASRSGTALNPFVPHKNDKSGRWAPPKYSLRRQAELIKHARASGTLHLLPPGPKMSSAQLLAATTTSTTPSSSSSSAVPGEAVEAAVMARNGLVSLRRGQVQGQGQRQELGQEGVKAEAQGETQARVRAPGLEDLQDALGEWTRPVEWVGTVRERSVAGADVGNRLYAGKKRMFKGHKWERTRERRVARTKVMLRDMDKRVERFKGVRLLFSFHCPPPFSAFWSLR
jgi:large subunit ribosomal protein L25